MFVLGFRIWNFFCWLFTFQFVCHVYFLVIQLFLPPAISTSHMLTYIYYFLFGNKKWQYFSGPLSPSFIVFANHSNAYKIVCILFPDWHSYFNFLHPLWVVLNSQRIRIDTQICLTQPKQPKFSIHNTKKKQQKQRKQLISTNSKNIFTYCFQPIQR